MIETILGEIEITINDKKVDYRYSRLSNKEKNFEVDGRYKIIIDLEQISGNEDKDNVVAAKLIKTSDNNIKECVESGERLAMLSFYSDNKKVSIGAEDERPGVLCTYDNSSVKVLISPKATIFQVTFGIAWITWRECERQEIYTWFAADPTMYKAV